MAAKGLPLDGASLLSVTLEGIVYGFSLLMFIGTIWALTYRQRIQDVSRPIAVVAILLLILSTAHIIVNAIRVQYGLVKDRDTFPGGPLAFFGDLTQPTMTIKNALYVLQTLLADGVVIYRCLVVWRSVAIIILPSMLWCSVAVTGTLSVYSVSQASNNPGDVFASHLSKWITAFMASTIATNLLSSGLLAYRIWTIERETSTARPAKDTMMPVVRVLVDTAVLYSVVLFTALICFACSNNGEVVMLDINMPIIAIAFYMVLIRLAINRKIRSQLSTVGVTNEMEQGNVRQYPMQSLQVHISQFTRNEDTSVFGIGTQDQPSTFKEESGKG
ncbi:hypothetical protein DEU56DRAFT_905521 [Suillus clintonianus]|uniref:uncharacterized protein n=1 Tax=Suillus clintonianus TaxID=1904413 RepID=UPI001B86521E|nr:uncharacterized protein DEU56DRAFT_905521 [Suillus clintonianus]KAG2111459.1 hypothetical protein DEU56DRAFT_905521 [Suillus clintonianus]